MAKRTYFVKGLYWDIYHESHDKRRFEIVVECEPSGILSAIASKVAKDERTDINIINIIKL